MLAKLKADERFKNLEKVVAFIIDCNQRIENFKRNYDQTVLADDVKQAIYENRTKLDAAESTFQKGPPKEWWDDAVRKLQEAKTSFNAFIAHSEYRQFESANQWVEEYRTRVATFEQNYREKVLNHDAKGAVYEVRTKLDQGKSYT
jgi:hypothetical protein